MSSQENEKPRKVSQAPAPISPVRGGYTGADNLERKFAKHIIHSLLLPANISFVVVGDVPQLIAKAIHPEINRREVEVVGTEKPLVGGTTEIINDENLHQGIRRVACEEEYKKLLEQAFNEGTLQILDPASHLPYGTRRAAGRQLNNSIIAVAELRHWMETVGIEIVIEPEQEESLPSSGSWPWGSHDTKLLGKLKAAAGKWWKNYVPGQPDTAPTSKQVQDWLKTQDVPDRVAEVMAQILRADGLPPGPRK